jgi:hypothetical protein
LDGKLKLEPSLGRTIVRLEQWATSLLAEGPDASWARFGGVSGCEGEGLIRAIAEHVTEEEMGIERELLRKSLQETLFYSVGTADRIWRADVEMRLLRFLRLRGTSGFVRRFLSFHIFNVVWFHSADSFRSTARSQNAFMDDMENLEQMCKRVVDSAWKSQRIRGSLPLLSAQELVGKIEQRLHGR